MSIDALLIVGAGGHAKVVVDAVRKSNGDVLKLYVCDDNAALDGERLMDMQVITPVKRALSNACHFHVAVGNNRLRYKLAENCGQAGLEFRSVIHPQSAIAASASVDAGCFIAAQAVIGPMAELEEGCIVNHGAVVDHDCRIGRFSHIAPNATLGGGVRIGEQVLIGAGVNVLPGVVIGDNCIVGAGAVVLADLPAHTTFAGVPAQRIR